AARMHTARKFSDYGARKRAEYVCQLDAPGCEATAESWRKRIDEAKAIQGAVRLLAREGFSLLDAKHLAALAPLCRHRIFEAGAILVGTHAFEVIVNRL